MNTLSTTPSRSAIFPRSWLMVLACVAWFLPAGALAQLPQTRLNTVFPPGGKIGSDVKVSISGEFSEAATQLVFSHPGISAKQQIDAPSEYRVAHRRPRNFDVSIAPDVPRGSYEVRAVGPTGLSNPRLFMVGELEEKQFSPDQNGRDNPYPLTVGQIVSARVRVDQRDYYRVAARQGQTLLLQIWAQRIDSRLDAGLAVYDAQGKRWGRVVQGQTRDPILAFTPPADGDYLIEVWDVTYRGGDEYPYRLEISQRPHVDTIFPPLARSDELAGFTIYGFNLPEGIPVLGSAHIGNLQSLRLRFKPRFEEAINIAATLSRGEIASAMIDGAAIRLPEPVRDADPVFVAKATSRVVIEQPGNDSPEEAQWVEVPCEIAGQFYPRRDVDWFEFGAKKGQTFWIELASQRLGANTDPTLRVRMKKTDQDGKVQFRDIATSDDMEGPPNSLDTRRFYSGSGDVSYRFRAEEDAVYQIAVRDLYNASYDDPRLVYSVTIRPQVTNFQLVAFANPAKHKDTKIVKPEGVSMLPGGTATIRVRLLPQHGFNGPVAVTAEALPAGITAWPVMLGSRMREGLLVLSAAPQAKPVAGSMRIVGRATVGDRIIRRIARTGTIRHGTNNVNNEATDVRLTRDLAVAVIDSTQSPAHVQPEAAVTSIGGKIKVPLRIDRREGFVAELQLAGAQVPKGIKVDTVKTKGTTAQVSLVVEDKGLPPGRYTFPLTGKVKEKRPRNYHQVKEAEGDLDKIKGVLAERDESLKSQEQKLNETNSLVAQAQKVVDDARKQTEAARNLLTKKLKLEHKAAATLAERLAAAAADVDREAWRGEVAKAEAAIASLKQQRGQLIEDVTTARKPVAVAMQTLKQRQMLLAVAKNELDEVRQKRDEAEKQRLDAEKRLGELKKSQLQQDHEFWIYSLPIQLEVRPTPVELLLGDMAYSLTTGGELAIPMLVRRRFGFAGQVTVNVTVPRESGIGATSVVLGPGQSAAKLVLTGRDDAKVGNWDAKIRSALQFNGIDLTHTQTCRVEVRERERE